MICFSELLRNCYKVASEQSDDLSNQNAACFVLADGTVTDPIPNRLPAGIKKTPERIRTRPTKYDFIEHAERGAVYEAARKGINLEGSTMVCPWIACADCSRAIVLSGVKRVITHKRRNELTSLGRDKIVDTVSDRWVNPISNGEIILMEAGIEVVQYDFHAEMKVLINEQLVEV